MTKKQLEDWLEESDMPDGTQILICDIQNDDDEKFHFDKLETVEKLKVRGKEHIALLFNT